MTPEHIELASESKAKYIDKVIIDNETCYLYQIQSRSVADTVYTITCKIVDDDQLISNPKVVCECECMGYKHREMCWHITEVYSLISELSSCVMCLTPFLDITLNNGREKVNAYDQDNNMILINKAGNILAHESCIKCYDEFICQEAERYIYKTFYDYTEGNKE